jgi:hypothetical protein
MYPLPAYSKPPTNSPQTRNEQHQYIAADSAESVFIRVITVGERIARDIMTWGAQNDGCRMIDCQSTLFTSH